MPSSTSSTPLVKGNAGGTHQMDVSRRVTARSKCEVPLPASAALSSTTTAPIRRSSQHLQPRLQALPSTLPGSDVVAFEVAAYSSVEPVLVYLRLRERIPMLPLGSSGAHAALLASAAPVDMPMRPLPRDEEVQSGACGVTAAAASSRLGGAAPHSSVCPRWCSISVGALLCLMRTNAMLRVLATPLRELPRPQIAADSASAATACHGAASPPVPNSLLSLAALIKGQLCRQKIVDAGRAALFTALAHTMGSKLLCARDDADCLSDSVAAGAADVTDRGELLRAQPCRTAAAEVSDGQSGGRGLDRSSGNSHDSAGRTTPMTLSSVTKAAADTSSGGATAMDSATPMRYRWQPARPLRGLVKEFVMHLHHYGPTDPAPEATVGVRATVSAAAGASNRDSSVSELQRVLETFTQYAHETAPVEFSLAVFDPILAEYVPYVYPLRAAAAQAARAGNAWEAASPWGASDLSVIRGFVGCVLHPCWLDMVLQGGRHRCGTDIDVFMATRQRQRSACSSARSLTTSQTRRRPPRASYKRRSQKNR
ncbi:hypothetical protein LSCM4_07775 [Leishmania orientalis]|uniref:Uncharacterized protein n=1 Tax=Leishmania orientalis TaxID=2249476 RepID=A0A836HZM0_9TRYP|nr:hypothetical protein LSCM4_07775 [Leishmania orientalis]